MSESQKASIIGKWLIRAIGAVLLVAGILKATDVTLFMAQLKAYGVITNPVLLLISAWGLVAIQCGLGAALLVGYRPTITLPITIILWLILICGTGWAVWSGSTDECGCFGALLKRSPQVAFIENLAFLAGTLFAWFTTQRELLVTEPIQRYTVCIACLFGIFLPLAFGVPISATINPDKARPVLHMLKDLEIAGIEAPELDKGYHIIILLSTDCAHCLDTLSLLDELADAKGVPSVVGVCPNDESERLAFVEQFEPSFPLGRIEADRFWKLLSTGDTPRIILVKDGSLIKAWDNGIVPSSSEIASLLDDRQ